MNCAECRENMVAQAEGCLSPEESLHCHSHLEICAGCRAEYAAITGLQQKLVNAGRTSTKVSIVEDTMRRIQATPPNIQKAITMTSLLSGWPFRLSAVACTALVLATALLLNPGTQARAAGVLAKGAQAAARLSSIHLQCRVRTRPDDNFPSIAPDQDFSSVEVWKQFGSETKWRVEKPGRVAVMDGQSAVLHLKNGNIAAKDRPAMNAFDTDWLQSLANLSETIEHEIHNARTLGWKLGLVKERAADGRTKAVVTILAKTSVPGDDYLKNKTIDLSDTRRVYRFDAQTGMLEGAQIYLVRTSGEVLIFEITQVECNQPMDAKLFQIELPENVVWRQELPLQPGDEKYIAMNPEQIARIFFEACSCEDWTEAGKLDGMPLSEGAKQAYGGLKIRSIGQAFTSKASPHRFVPYEVQLRNGDVKKWNLALRRNEKTAMWCVDGGF